MQSLWVGSGALRTRFQKKREDYEVYALRHVALVQEGHYRQVETSESDEAGSAIKVEDTELETMLNRMSFSFP